MDVSRGEVPSRGIPSARLPSCKRSSSIKAHRNDRRYRNRLPWLSYVICFTRRPNKRANREEKASFTIAFRLLADNRKEAGGEKLEKKRRPSSREIERTVLNRDRGGEGGEKEEK